MNDKTIGLSSNNVLFKKLRILIVDDEKKWQNFHKDAFINLFSNSSITVATSAEDALKILEKNNYHFDYITTDLQMENVNDFSCAGEWLLDKIKKTNKFNMSNVAIISASDNIDKLALKYKTKYIRKISALTSINSYINIVE